MTRRYNAGEVEGGFRKLQSYYRQNPGNGLLLRSGKEHFGWYYVDGKAQFQVSSKKGPGTVGPGRAHKLAQYLRLDDTEFAELCDCPLTGPQYHSRVVARMELGYP